ncbi:MAG: hypothetical protein CL791_06255 [Chloroflexi bacterium]|nr:hypothetical protein [Chloroflexota bacterium]|tara:strand:- start:382 stop:687 length:306 start_codon:yes stop_codon:yes gene_type:complete
MITLHVYLIAKTNKSDDMLNTIVDPWINAMEQQPGFIQATLLTDPQGNTPEQIEVISYWESEELRLEWVARPIHDEVFAPIIELSESISSTVKNVNHTWKL